MSTERKCGDCQLCCKLLPTKEIGKVANTRCEHQRTGKGCMIYDRRPFSCSSWSCRWLLEDDTADLSRPDRSHYVIDLIPDYVTAVHEDGRKDDIPVLQVWVDPAHRDAHRDPHLRAYIARQGEKYGMAALIRFGSTEAFVLAPPAISSDGQWHEQSGDCSRKEHSLADTLSKFGGRVIMEERP